MVEWCSDGDNSTGTQVPGSSEKAGDLVTERAVVGMFHYRHQLDAVVTCKRHDHQSIEKTPFKPSSQLALS